MMLVLQLYAADVEKVIFSKDITLFIHCCSDAKFLKDHKNAVKYLCVYTTKIS